MFPLNAVSCRYCPARIFWLLAGCLGFAALLITPALAQAQTVYVLANGASSSAGVQQYLTVVNGATNAKGPRITLGLAGIYSSMALAPDGQRVYVTNDRDETVSVISTATNTVIQTLPKSLFHGPGVLQAPVEYVAVSPDSQRIYVVAAVGISVTDTTTFTRINYRGGIYGQLVVSPDGTRLYVRIVGGVSGPDRVLVLDSTTLVTLADVELPPPHGAGVDISVTPDGRYVHLTRSRTGTGSGLAVLDTTTNTIIHERPTPNAYAWASATSPNGAYLYVVGNRPTDQLYRFSPTTYLELSTTSGVGSSYDVAFTADSARAYVAAISGVHVIDTATHAVSNTIPFFSGTDGSPRAVAVLGASPLGATPSNLRATAIDGNRVSLAWNQPASGPALSYVIEGGLTPGSVLGSLPTGSPATTFTFDAPTGVFYIRVHAITSSGRTAASNEIQIFVNVPQLPSPPTNLLGLANGSNLALSWTPGATGGAATSFILDVSGATTVSMPIGPAEMFQFPNVPAGTYTFRVRAQNAAGTSAASSSLTLTFPGVCSGPPQMPRNVVVQRSGSFLNVVWDAPSAGPAVTSYVVNVTGALNLTLPFTTRRAAGNVPSGTYNLSVAAVNPCGTGTATVPQSISIP